MADKKKKFNKAAFLRSLLSDTPGITWSEVQEEFKLQKQTVTQAQFYQVRTALNGGSKSGTTSTKSKPRKRRAAAVVRQTGKSQTLLAGVAKKGVSSRITAKDVSTILAVDAEVALVHGQLTNLTGCRTAAAEMIHEMVNGMCDSNV